MSFFFSLISTSLFLPRAQLEMRHNEEMKTEQIGGECENPHSVVAHFHFFLFLWF